MLEADEHNMSCIEDDTNVVAISHIICRRRFNEVLDVSKVVSYVLRPTTETDDPNT